MTAPTVQPEGVPPASTHWVAPWCTVDDIPQGLLTDSNGQPVGDVPLELLCAAASWVLWSRTRRRYRCGRSIVRPTQIQDAYGAQSYLYPYASMSGYGGAWGFAAGWAWTAIGMGWWQTGQDLTEVVLQGPVTRINSVMVDGTVLEPNQYALYERRRLVRNVDSTGATSSAWPWNQQLQLPVTMPGTWQIDYEWGRVPPPMGKAAAVELTVQLALALSGQDSSKLAARVSRVSTQGVDVALMDAVATLQAGLIGLPLCDTFIETDNPSHARRRSVFLAPNSVLNRSS